MSQPVTGVGIFACPVNPNDILPWLEWVKNLHLSGLEEGFPSMGPPKLPPCAGGYPSWKEIRMLNHLPGLSGPVERPDLSS
jgi:hypothetical protein